MKKITLFRHPLFAVLILLNSCIHSPSKTEVTETTEAITNTNGDLNNSFVEEAPKVEMSQEQILAQEKERVLSEGWEEKEIENGQLSTCYNFAPKKRQYRQLFKSASRRWH